MQDTDWAIGTRERRKVAALVEPMLVIDDSSTMIEVLTRMLAEIGVTEVLGARSAEAAFRLMRQVDFKLILCDIVMDAISGWQFQSILRAMGQTRQIPFVLMTTDLNSHHALRAKSTSASGFILKPFNSRQLHAKLLEAVQGS